jgi:hypothetical protein
MRAPNDFVDCLLDAADGRRGFGGISGADMYESRTTGTGGAKGQDERDKRGT